MEILGYIVQYFHEDRFLPDTGFKYLYKSFQPAVDHAKTRASDYVQQYPNGLPGPFEFHSPTKKQTDGDGYAVVFRNSELQIWIEVIVAK